MTVNETPAHDVELDTKVTVRVEFRDEDDVLDDPGAVSFWTRAPNGTAVEHTWPGGDGVITHDGVGLFSAYVVVNVAGTWWARFVSSVSGPITSVEGRINVDVAHVPVA